MKTILLMGNPNVGKSAIFSRMTGVSVIASNYSGTTVEYTSGKLQKGEGEHKIIDVPGTYSLEPTCKAEEVAVRMIEAGDIIINVIDATNLERNLYLTFELMERGTPLIVALNMWDDVQHKGIFIDYRLFENLVGVPVIPVVGVTGKGINELISCLEEPVPLRFPSLTAEERWKKIEEIINKVQSLGGRKHTFLEKLEDLSVNPKTGIPIAIGALSGSFIVVRAVGEGLIEYIFDPLFETFYMPVLYKISNILGETGVVHDILMGKFMAGSIDFSQSFGLLSTGIYVPLAMVLPYVFAFYLVLSFLEDIGYLPRLAILADNAMHEIGLHGYSVIPFILGFGCNVPGILSTRVLESERERFIACTILAIGIPCAALQAMIISFMGILGLGYVLLVYMILFSISVMAGIMLNTILPGESPEFFAEMPPFRLPNLKVMLKKLWMRLKGFLREAVPTVIIGVLVVNILYILGFFDILAAIAAPVISGILGLPAASASALLIGFLRKDMAMALLTTMGLTASQLLVGTVVLTVFFPCIATFTVLLREMGIKNTMKITAIVMSFAILAGGIVNLILANFTFKLLFITGATIVLGLYLFRKVALKIKKNNLLLLPVENNYSIHEHCNSINCMGKRSSSFIVPSNSRNNFGRKKSSFADHFSSFAGHFLWHLKHGFCQIVN